MKQPSKDRTLGAAFFERGGTERPFWVMIWTGVAFAPLALFRKFCWASRSSANDAKSHIARTHIAELVDKIVKGAKPTRWSNDSDFRFWHFSEVRTSPTNVRS